MLQKVLNNSKLYLKRNGSTILTFIGAAGVITTAVMAANETPKALRLIEAKKEEKGAKLTRLETITAAAPAYLPSVLMGASTIACVFGANALNQSQQASLASAYALLNRSYTDYRNKVKEIYGPEADKEIRAAIMRDRYLAEPPEIHAYGFGCLDGLESIADPGELVTFYEEFSNQYFESTIVEVQAAEYHLNRNFALRGSASVNEFYQFLGIKEPDNGVILGWDMASGYGWVDFTHQKVTIDNDLECYVINYEFMPDIIEEY